MAFLLDGREKFEVANKQKWISYETLLGSFAYPAKKVY
jgi:hypothetical protein